MTEQDVLLERIADLKDHVLEQIALARETNGRLRKAETNVAVLNKVVFGGGAVLLTVVGYLFGMHLK